MIKKFKQNLNRLQKWERLPKIQWFVNNAYVEHNMDNITKNKFYIYIAFVNREQQEKHTKENKQTTASIIQQQQKKRKPTNVGNKIYFIDFTIFSKT